VFGMAGERAGIASAMQSDSPDYRGVSLRSTPRYRLLSLRDEMIPTPVSINRP
jgi:hypothetical protein